MSSSIHVKNHPFRFLLYLEWALLGLSTLTAIMPAPLHRFSVRFPEMTIFSLIVFGLMGLRLPTNSKFDKVIYTALEVFLILSIGFFGGKAARLFPFLYLILVTRSCLIFKLPGRIIITILSFILFLFTLQHRLLPFRLPPPALERFRFFGLSLALLFGLSLIFVLLLMNAVLSERQSREKLAIANEKLRQYALQIENQATLEERNRIAREIHDSLGHSLTALNLQLETAVKLLPSNPTKATLFLARAKELGSKTLQDVRHSVSAMRHHPLQAQSLDQVISILAEDFQLSNNILVQYKIAVDHPLPKEISNAIYRIIQEALTNISKYANASEVNLELTTTQTINLIIQDNGRGFDLQQNTSGFGLQSMRDRTVALGGNLEIHSTNGSGCQIKVHIPLPNNNDD
ncbi:sensor histidine kinase [Cronbergia sp. UHCC 0137]|uniref:sensor histidine kinase n=1 Tax=Cronbergia sp. UHCC 0137 TaxID=3110239 RepID=UPI002B201E95|nr:sensor histidine kinase [Cronbergia sp. UHCC 0137]MEA5616306.1 sensor histidine kinase [Cronbergia sp. UHCC 0137]